MATTDTPAADLGEAGRGGGQPRIFVPGVIDGLAEETYLRHPALSASGAKLLLPPSCPALFRWQQDNPPPPKRVFDFGHAAHAAVLGVGAEVVVIQTTAKDGTTSAAENRLTKSAQQHEEEIRAQGQIPLLARELEQVNAMVTALREHPVAAALLNPDQGGRPEQSLFWHDPTHGVDRRARVDWLREPVDGRLILVDYKTTTCAEPGTIRRSVADYRYHLSAAWYQDLVVGLGLAEDVPFVLIFQEKTAPYLVTVVELDIEALMVGRRLADRALRVFADCSTAGTWPSYTNEIELVSLPDWAAYVPEELSA